MSVFENYSYIFGTSGSGATITFGGLNGAPSAYTNIGAAPTDYKSIGFYINASSGTGTYNFTFTITPSNGAIDVWYIVSQNPATAGANASDNFDPNLYYDGAPAPDTDNLGTLWPGVATAWSQTTANSTINLTGVPDNYFVSVFMSKNGQGSGTITTTSSVCFASNTLVLMGDYSYKQIKDIERFDQVISDIETNSKSIVSKSVSSYTITDCAYKIPIGLMSNSNEIIGKGIHPIWINNGKQRVLLKDIEGVERVTVADRFYNLQFDHEGTFYVEGIKVDSLSPYHRKLPLGKENFINPELYQENIISKSETDSHRNKPELVSRKVDPSEVNSFSIQTINLLTNLANGVEINQSEKTILN